MHITAHQAVLTGRVRLPLRLASFVVATLMYAVAVAMWTAVPAAVLWVARTYFERAEFVLVLVATVLAIASTALPLVKLDQLYGRLSAARHPEAGKAAAARPVRRGRGRETAPCTLLDRVLIVSVLAALGAFVAWYALLGQCSSSCM